MAQYSVYRHLIILISLSLMLVSTANAQNEVDHSLFSELLTRHVSGGKVDYQGFQSDEDRLDQYLDALSGVDPAQLIRNEQMAYYINAYNAWTIKLILTAYPKLKSIKDLGSLFKSPWKKKFVKLDGETVTLDYIEHDILRPVYKDPRIHFAINCAARSCPPLMAEAYTGALLDQQLDKMTRNFINDGQSNYLDGNTLHVSRIFKWFGEDFDNDIAGYVRTYATGDFATQLQEAGDSLNVKYLDYDWSLNSK